MDSSPVARQALPWMDCHLCLLTLGRVPSPLPRGLSPFLSPSPGAPPYHDHAWGSFAQVGEGPRRLPPPPCQGATHPHTHPAALTSSSESQVTQNPPPGLLEGDCVLQDLLPRGPDAPTSHHPSWEKKVGCPGIEVEQTPLHQGAGRAVSWSVRMVVCLESPVSHSASDFVVEPMSPGLEVCNPGLPG